jgi:AcrR family transcriptional regulator
MRANGEASRLRILDAALEIAGERGYSGTSISEVSKRSGLPNSSIYWYFADKDALLAAVIDHSYDTWRSDFEAHVQSAPSTPGEALNRLFESLSYFPAFLRFGLLVTLEQTNADSGARDAFLRIREKSLVDLATIIGRLTNCSKSDAKEFASLSLAMMDGAVIAGAAGEKSLAAKGMLGRMLDACVAPTVS